MAAMPRAMYLCIWIKLGFIDIADTFFEDDVAVLNKKRHWEFDIVAQRHVELGSHEPSDESIGDPEFAAIGEHPSIVFESVERISAIVIEIVPQMTGGELGVPLPDDGLL